MLAEQQTIENAMNNNLGWKETGNKQTQLLLCQVQLEIYVINTLKLLSKTLNSYGTSYSYSSCIYFNFDAQLVTYFSARPYLLVMVCKKLSVCPYDVERHCKAIQFEGPADWWRNLIFQVLIRGATRKMQKPQQDGCPAVTSYCKNQAINVTYLHRGPVSV